MDSTNFETFFKKVWNKSNILIDADDFNLKILTAIIFCGKHQIKLGEEIIFNLIKSKYCLDLKIPNIHIIELKMPFFYYKINFFKCKLKNNREWIFHVIKTFEKPMNYIYFNKERRFEIDNVLRDGILQFDFHDLFTEMKK